MGLQRGETGDFEAEPSARARNSVPPFAKDPGPSAVKGMLYRIVRYTGQEREPAPEVAVGMVPPLRLLVPYSPPTREPPAHALGYEGLCRHRLPSFRCYSRSVAGHSATIGRTERAWLQQEQATSTARMPAASCGPI